MASLCRAPLAVHVSSLRATLLLSLGSSPLACGGTAVVSNGDGRGFVGGDARERDARDADPSCSAEGALTDDLLAAHGLLGGNALRAI